MEFNPHEVNLLIRSRRSVKPSQLVAGKRVPDEIIRQIIENASWAPNHGKTEPWYFKIFTNDGLKMLADFQSELYKVKAGEKFNEGKYKKLQSQPMLCSHIIAICMRRDVTGKIRELEEIEAVACAVQNIYLTVTAYGLGGYWSTGGVTYIPEAKDFFGLGEADQLLGFFSLGYVAEHPSDTKRKPAELISDWVTEL